MAECSVCGIRIGFMDAIEKKCSDCFYAAAEQEEITASSLRESHRQAASIAQKAIDSITLTTAHTLQDVTVTQYLGVVSAECAYGMNMFKDMFANVRNLVGGRSAAVEDTMRDSRETVMQELKREAHAKGANAVIAVDLDYTQLGAGGNMMVLVSASGTAVVIEE